MTADLSLKHFVRVYDQHLSAEHCAALRNTFATQSQWQQPNGRGHRAGLDASQWTEMHLSADLAPELHRYMHERFTDALARYNQDLGLLLAIPNSSKRAPLVIKRYLPGGDERFQLHFDAIYEKSNRYLVALWYLNDVPSGGETVFPDLQLAVTPQTGRLLVFPPYWLFQHAGEPPVGGEKLIISSYLEF